MRCVTGLILILCVAFAPAVGRAAAKPYQGIYTIVDPYNAPSIKLLQTAAATSCASQTHTVTTPYCGATNGILLRMNWCDFELYHVTGPTGAAYPSCHYGVIFSNGAGSAGSEVADEDEISPCQGAYDTCSGTRESILGTTLGLIRQIDAQRATAGLAPLNISMGLGSGGKTPQSVIDAVGYVDVPFATSSAATAAECLRMPRPWTATYTSDFNRALDQLVSYVQAQGVGPITILKVGDVSGDSLEVDMPGQAQPASAPADPGDGGPGAALACSAVVTPGQVWLSAYEAAPVGNYTLSQADEHVFGDAIGHALATLANDGLGGTLLSLPTTNGQAFPMVNCGTTGSSACAVSSTTGVWTTYYLELYLDDLFDGGLASTAARNAYGNARSGTFSLSPAQLALNWTGLTATALVPSGQITCTINNTVAANAPVQWLDQQSVQIQGVGTVIGWQSQTNQGGLCSSGGYAAMLNNGINNGGTFLEIESDAAFADIGSCSAPLTSALAKVLKVKAPGACQF